MISSLVWLLPHCVMRFLQSILTAFSHCIWSSVRLISPSHPSSVWPECLPACLMAWWRCTPCWMTSLWTGRPTCARTPSTKRCLTWRTRTPDRDPTPSGAWLWSAAAPRWAERRRRSQQCLCVMDGCFTLIPSVFVSYGSLTVRECWSSTLWVSTPFGGWIPTTRRPPLYPWRATSVCREKRRCGCWMTTATRCSCTTLHPTNSVHSTGEWCSDVRERTQPRLGLQIWTRSRKTEIEVVHHHKKWVAPVEN